MACNGRPITGEITELIDYAIHTTWYPLIKETGKQLD
jgi:hypothetical protein